MIEPVIKRLDELSGGDKSFQIELIQIFLAESEKNFLEIKNHLTKSDYSQAARSVHAVKGAALNIGSNHFGTLLENLERQFANGDQAAELYAECTTTFAVFQEQLTDYLTTLQS